MEFTDGYLEILPTPSRGHQRMLAFLHSAFRAFLQPAGAPLRLRVRQGKFREPDLVVVRDAVVEVVSPEHPERDLVDKRDDYAEAAIPEYWIVDPATETMVCSNKKYADVRAASAFERQADARGGTRAFAMSRTTGACPP